MFKRKLTHAGRGHIYTHAADDSAAAPNRKPQTSPAAQQALNWSPLVTRYSKLTYRIGIISLHDLSLLGRFALNFCHLWTRLSLHAAQPGQWQVYQPLSVLFQWCLRWCNFLRGVVWLWARPIFYSLLRDSDSLSETYKCWMENSWEKTSKTS
jgi:hypothetical protein